MSLCSAASCVAAVGSPTMALCQRRLTRSLPAAIDREIARAGKDRARLQTIEPADRVAEMRGIGIADILREMGEVEVLIGEMQEMPRALPGAEGAEGNAGLLLEQMQETRSGKTVFRRTARRRRRLAREFPDGRDRPHHARIEPALRQSFAKAHPVELGCIDVGAALPRQQHFISKPDTVREQIALGALQ